jgi:tetratricopeptide (TPR) repeat protein
MRMANADHEKAWELLLQSKELYAQHEYANAVPLLRKAIKLNPGQGDFYHLLGLCQSEAEISKNEAEMNLKKAIELKSWSADPVYALGVLYRGQGKMKLAERCFQRVKEISYEHAAPAALVDLPAEAGQPAQGQKEILTRALRLFIGTAKVSPGSCPGLEPFGEPAHPLRRRA